MWIRPTVQSGDGAAAPGHSTSRDVGPPAQLGATFKASSSGPPTQGGHRNSSEPLYTRVLQPLVFSTKKGRWVPADYRPEAAKRLPDQGKIQDGDSSLHLGGTTGQRLDFFGGPEGRILPHSDCIIVKEVPAVCDRREDLPVPGASVWTIPGTAGLHKDHERNSRLRTSPWSGTSHISGRLANTFSVADEAATGYGPGSHDMFRPGPINQLSEIEPGPDQGVRFLRDTFLDSQALMPTIDRPFPSAMQATKVISANSPASSIQLAQSAGHVKVNGHASSTRHCETSPIAVKFPQQVVQLKATVTPPSCDFQSGQTPDEMVASNREYLPRTATSPLPGASSNFHGCVKNRMGGAYGLADSIRQLAAAVSGLQYQLVGDGSHTPGAQALAPSNQGQGCPSEIRQPDDRVLSQQAGGHEITTTVLPGLQDNALVPEVRRTSGLPTHCRDSERQGRQSLPERQSNQHGMVSTSRCDSSAVEQMGTATSGSVCHVRECQTPSVCLSVPGHSGLGDGRSQHQLGGAVGVRLPADAPYTKSSSESTSRTGRTDSNCTLVAQEDVDSGRLSPLPGTSSGIAAVGHATSPTTDKPFPSGPKDAQSARLEAVAHRVAASGFSTKVAARIARGKLRSSSLKVYDARWNFYASWCKQRHLDPWKSSIATIADFLLYLFEKGDRTVRTIEGYRAAIASTLSLLGINVGQDKSLSRLIQGFYAERPLRQNTYPKWSLPIVLAGLMRHPFENLGNASFADLTRKTIFLLAMASGARRGELHAIDFTRIAWDTNKTQVTLRPHPDFVAKNYDPRLPASNFGGFTIKAFDQFVGKDDKERTLCPVRALKFYLAASKSRRAGRKQLFLPIRETKKEAVSKNTISRWIAEAIKHAYIAADKVAELRQVHKISSHEVRAVTTSCDAWRQVSLGDIMDSCGWRSSHTFVDFYLRDLVVFEKDLVKFKQFPTPATSAAK